MGVQDISLKKELFQVKCKNLHLEFLLHVIDACLQMYIIALETKVRLCLLQEPAISILDIRMTEVKVITTSCGKRPVDAQNVSSSLQWRKFIKMCIQQKMLSLTVGTTCKYLKALIYNVNLQFQWTYCGQLPLF